MTVYGERLARIEEKLDSLNEKFDSVNERVKNIEGSDKMNTEFRLKTTGVVAVLTVIGGVVGGFIMWVLNRFYSK